MSGEYRMWFERRQRYRILVTGEASALIDAHGDSAYDVAREVMRLARDRGDRASETYYSQVAQRIARLSGREIGLDTATRYLE